MDDCHARTEHYADCPGHGKNYLVREREAYGGSISPVTQSHPQKEKVEKYAESFQKLADTFYGMPYRKDYLSSGQVEQILKDTGENVCTRCYQQELCWQGEPAADVYLGRGTDPCCGKKEILRSFSVQRLSG